MGLTHIGDIVIFIALGTGGDGTVAAANPEERGLAPGDRFTVRIEYSNRWSVEAVGPRKRTARASTGAPSAADTRTPVSARGSTGGVDTGSSPTQGTVQGRSRGPKEASTAPLPDPATGPFSADRPHVEDVQLDPKEPKDPGRSGDKGAGPENGAGQPSSRQGNAPHPAANLGKDPLFADISFVGEAGEDGRLSLELHVSRVRYTDLRTKDWTIEPGRTGAVDRAQEMARKVVARWSAVSYLDLEREMLEEELLGLALILLDGVRLEAALGAPGEAPRMPALYTALEGRLRGTIPAEGWRPAMAFLEEAAAGLFAPQVERPRAGAAFQSGGIPYTISSVGSRSGRPVAQVFGNLHQGLAGVASKDWVTADLRTGLALERDAYRILDKNLGSTARFGQVHWRQTVTELRPAAHRP